MSESKAKPSSGQALSDALAKLKVYDHGSPRAPLLPIDRAASSLPSGSSGGKQLEQELLAILRAGCSVVAQDYVCSRFVLVGSEAAVPALEALLGSRELTTSARTALEHIPHAVATRALQDSLPKLTAEHQAEVLSSLGARRDPAAVVTLAAYLRYSDPVVFGAAAAALAQIGSAKAAEALMKSYAAGSQPARKALADPLLTCAEQLHAAGKKGEAERICALLDDPAQPRYVRKAATRGRG